MPLVNSVCIHPDLSTGPQRAPPGPQVRLGTSAAKINVAEVTALLEGAGAAAVIIHGRTAEQRCFGPTDAASEIFVCIQALQVGALLGPVRH